MDENDQPAALEARAKEFAIAAHGDQKYGRNEPYAVHLASVRDILVEFGWDDGLIVWDTLAASLDVTTPRAGDMLVAAWLHDVIEDTDATRGTLEREFGPSVASLVWAVTGRGKNRKERNADAYRKLAAFPAAIPLKLADRLSNVRNSKRDKLEFFDMYEGEYPAFRAALAPACAPDPRTARMWYALDKLLGFPIRPMSSGDGVEMKAMLAAAMEEDGEDLSPAGGFSASRDRTLDLLAAACRKRDVREVQRLALMTLTWWNGEFTVIDGDKGGLYGELLKKFRTE